jgi:hypothetical protein
VFFIFPDKLKHEQQRQIQHSPKDDIGVCIFTIDFGHRHFLLWSNRRAEQAEDGTITISTTSEGDFE